MPSSYDLPALFDFPRSQVVKKLLNSRASYFNYKNFLGRPSSKAAGFYFLRFSIADQLARAYNEVYDYVSAQDLKLDEMSFYNRNLLRFNKFATLRKKNVEAKGRSPFTYFTQKKT
jgi:hypothetical protein